MATLTVKPRARIFHGHDWVYAAEVGGVLGDPRPGDTVTLRDRRGRMLGSAIYNPASQIVARRYCRQKQALDEDFFVRRISQAHEHRVARGFGGAEACRVVWSESDGLPGLVVDRYADVLVVQALTLAMDRALPVITDALRHVFHPRGILARNDAPIRRAEGLGTEVRVLAGDVPESLPVRVDGLVFEIRPLDGQKTGFYLDQSASYRVVAAQAADGRVLDCFANQGAFALFCARAGAASVTAVEISAEGVAGIRRNAAANGLAVEAVEANVFDHLNDLLRGDGRFDLIILDPPSFTKSKGRHADALRGYKEIHLRALRLLNPGGRLATFTCSHHVSARDLRAVIVDASVDARRHVRQIESLTQSADHPILPHIPETEYLNGFLLETLPPR